jgi:hypothetical protein
VAEVGVAEVGAAEVGVAEVSPVEVSLDVRVLAPLRIPRLGALLQDLEMLWVRHRSRLPLCLLNFG